MFRRTFYLNPWLSSKLYILLIQYILIRHHLNFFFRFFSKLSRSCSSSCPSNWDSGVIRFLCILLKALKSDWTFGNEKVYYDFFFLSSMCFPNSSFVLFRLSLILVFSVIIFELLLIELEFKPRLLSWKEFSLFASK